MAFIPDDIVKNVQSNGNMSITSTSISSELNWHHVKLN